MSFKIPVKYTILIVLGLIVALFLAGYIIGHKKAVIASNATISALNAELTRTVVTLNNTKLYVTSVEQEIKTLREAKQAGELTNKELRTLNLSLVNENTRLKIEVDTLFQEVFFGGQVIEIHDTINVTSNAIKLPFMFDKSDKWMALKGNFDENGKLALSLKLTAGVDIWTGIDKQSKLPIAKIVTDCPYINTLSINSVKLDTQKPKKFGVGMFLGYGINISGTVKASPLIGVGISYNFIRF
jgi:hypothetical protein